MKLYYGLITLILLISLASAQTYKQNDVVNIAQSCINSSYSNVSRVVYPNSTFSINVQTIMTKAVDEYNYSYSSTGAIGRYNVYGICDENGIKRAWSSNFNITPSGEDEASGSFKVLIYLLIILVISSLIYFTLYTLGHFITIDFDIRDLGINFTALFLLFFTSWLTHQYITSLFINDLLATILTIATWTNGFLPVVALIISMIVGSIKNKGVKTQGYGY